MATVNKRAHKHFQLDAVKIKRAQKVLKAKTETEAIETCVGFHDRLNTRRIVWRLRPMRGLSAAAIEIKDVYRKLAD